VLARPFLVRGHQVIIGASIGLATLLPGETDPAELMRRADVALYKSKNSGRGCFSWFEDGMFTALNERRFLETDLRKALLLDQFELAYQSQFDFQTNSITGFEALLRWKHPDRGMVSPADFIPIAEETGEILKIGAWVLRQACRTAVSWPDNLMIAVNVSPVQFEADGFVESVLSALSTSGLAPCRLELELTETVLLTDDKIVIERMEALRAAGVNLSLDDFGTGYSSLNYLRKYPFTKVKIDQSFIREPVADENAHRIVTAVAGLGIAMGMSVIAEGVETEDQLSRIRLQGCSAAQGYLFSRPISGCDVAAYLHAAKARGFHPPKIVDSKDPVR
jgi:predicted signal transduction protein with EAL and GGDEF domain